MHIIGKPFGYVAMIEIIIKGAFGELFAFQD